MSTNPELTPEILAELRTALEEKRRRLSAIVGDLRVDQDEDNAEVVDADDDAPGDRGDSSVELEEWDENHQEELDAKADLAEVVHALTKFDAGTYGICEVCGRPIPVARLRAMPEALYDVEHERARELGVNQG